MTDKFTPVANILKQYEYDPSKLIPILQKYKTLTATCPKT